MEANIQPLQKSLTENGHEGGVVGEEMTMQKLIEGFVPTHGGGQGLKACPGVVITQLNSDGNGEGSILGGTQLEFNEDGQLEVERFGNQYAKLVNVRAWD